MSETRARILDRLRANRPATTTAPSTYSKPLGWNRAQRIAAFTERMQAVHGEVHQVARGAWADWLQHELPARGLHRVLVGNGAIGNTLSDVSSAELDIRRYEQPIEDWKPELFNAVDVSVTSTRCGLAESGSLVLWPDNDEPRLMSLVPPVHVAILDSNRLHENFAEAIAAEGWAAGMPTNALLISGPSKTADIEQTLAYGIHGPKQLITLLLD